MLGSSEVWSAEILKNWYTSAFHSSKLRVSTVSDNYIQAAKLYARIDGVKIFLRDCLMDMSLRGDALNATVVYPQQIESNIPGFWTELFVEFPDGVSVTLPIFSGCTKIDTYNTMTISFT